MELSKAKRIYTTKIKHILNRPDIQNSKYQHEFMNKMTDSEINIFLKEIKKQLKVEGISTKNINTYNTCFKALLQSRQDVYTTFKDCR